MIRWLALATLVATTGAHAQSDYLTIEDVVTLKTVSSAHLSPDGERIAYTLSVPREVYIDADGPAWVELHVSDMDGNSRPYVTGEVNVASVSWSADGDAIFFLAKRNAEAEFNSLYRIRVGGGEAEVLFTHVNNIGGIAPSPDGTRIAFTAPGAPPEQQKALEEKGFKAVVYEESVPNVQVWMLDLETLEATPQDLPGSASTIAWSADASRYGVVLAPTALIDDSFTSQDIHVVNASSGEVLSEIGSVGKLGSFRFSPDGERIAYIGSVDINDPMQGRLYVASVMGGERRDVVPNYAGHVADFEWADDVTLRWLGNRGVWREWRQASIASTAEAGDAPDGGPIITSIDTQPGLSVAAATAHTPEHPAELYLLRDGAEPLRLTNSNPILDERRLARQEVIRYEARDGLDIEAILIHPSRREDGGNPLVVMVHGGPEANYSNGWMTTYSLPGQVLAGRGYAVVYPNYRGSTGRGVEYSKLGQHDYAEEEFNDLVDAKRYLVGLGLADGDKVGITGGSYGGYASMWSASALSEEYAAAVAFVGISNQVSKFGTGDIPREMYHVHSRAWPWDDWMWMLERSPVYHTDKVRTPLLIMGGDKDPRVHPEQSLEMYRFTRLRTDTPVRYVIYPGEQHGNVNTAAQYDYGLRMLRWMEHYLRGPGGEPPPYDLGHAKRLADATE